MLLGLSRSHRLAVGILLLHEGMWSRFESSESKRGEAEERTWVFREAKLVPLGRVFMWKSGMAWESKSSLSTYRTNCTQKPFYGPNKRSLAIYLAAGALIRQVS